MQPAAFRPVLAGISDAVSTVVAIPVKDEAERLPACLSALAEQVDRKGQPLLSGSFGVLIFANNCRDGSAALARSLAQSLPFPLRVVEGWLPPDRAHAGGARRAAMDLAAAWLAEGHGDDGVILTTDADSRVFPDWVDANLTCLARGADAVLGTIMLDPAEDEALPTALHRRGALEGTYEALLTEIAALLDPLEHDPWPHHRTRSGASIAVTAAAYRRAGGMPAVRLGEDKAFVAALLAEDARLRFDPAIRVITSGRLFGRAAGGVADTLRQRSEEPDALCDEALEPVAMVLYRAAWRGWLRRLWSRRGALVPAGWVTALAIPVDASAAIGAATRFGAAWDLVEQASPRLTRQRLTPSDLPEQIRQARNAVAALRSLEPAQDVEAEFGMPVGADRMGDSGERSGQGRRSVIAA
jgi:hypothetical protein